MADYKAMYTTLFNNVTDVISILQQSQQKAEEIYISGEDAVISIVEKPENKNDGGDHT